MIFAPKNYCRPLIKLSQRKRQKKNLNYKDFVKGNKRPPEKTIQKQDKIQIQDNRLR